jgi:hypothetical protein
VVATIGEQPFTVAKNPVSSWSFAIRVWVTIILALFVSFWLQLESPTTVALTVAVLAEPQARLCVGDHAEAKLTGYSAPIKGHIAV